MPEGDTVYATADRLRRVLAGRTLVTADIRVPRFAAVDLRGRTVDAVTSRGKHLVIAVGDAPGDGAGAAYIHTHLKMEGFWHTARSRPSRRLPSWRPPSHEARIILRTSDTEAVGYRLGICEVLDRTELDARLARLGPDLLGPDLHDDRRSAIGQAATPGAGSWDPAEATRRLSADPDRPVGLALLDQTVMAGVGNIYRSEACFLRGVDPAAPVSSTDPAAMTDLCRRLLWANRLRTRTTTGVARDGSRLWVYGRAGEPCRRCGTLIERRSLGSAHDPERSTYVCRSCQRGIQNTT